MKKVLLCGCAIATLSILCAPSLAQATECDVVVSNKCCIIREDQCACDGVLNSPLCELIQANVATLGLTSASTLSVTSSSTTTVSGTESTVSGTDTTLSTVSGSRTDTTLSTTSATGIETTVSATSPNEALCTSSGGTWNGCGCDCADGYIRNYDDPYCGNGCQLCSDVTNEYSCQNGCGWVWQNGKCINPIDLSTYETTYEDTSTDTPEETTYTDTSYSETPEETTYTDTSYSETPSDTTTMDATASIAAMCAESGGEWCGSYCACDGRVYSEVCPESSISGTIVTETTSYTDTSYSETPSDTTISTVSETGSDRECEIGYTWCGGSCVACNDPGYQEYCEDCGYTWDSSYGCLIGEASTPVTETTYTDTSYSETPEETTYTDTSYSETPEETTYTDTSYSETPEETTYTDTSYSETPEDTTYTETETEILTKVYTELGDEEWVEAEYVTESE